MKHIVKKAPPHAWVKYNDPAGWVDQDGNPMNWTYEHNIDAPIRQILKQSLLEEQGGLCGYTGLRVTLDDSHVEHLKPQHLCVNHEDVDYYNLILAYPNGNSNCEFGAKAKDDWYDKNLFISPLMIECETSLLYSADGNVDPIGNNDQRARKTIDVLYLKAPRLQRLRKGIIETVFEQELSTEDIARYIAALDRKDENGLYFPFCFVIKQVLQSYLL